MLTLKGALCKHGAKMLTNKTKHSYTQVKRATWGDPTGRSNALRLIVNMADSRTTRKACGSLSNCMGSTLSTRVFTRLSVGRFQKSELFVGLYLEMSTENLFSASVPSRVRNMSQHTKTGNKKGATHWTLSTSIYEF